MLGTRRGSTVRLLSRTPPLGGRDHRARPTRAPSWSPLASARVGWCLVGLITASSLTGCTSVTAANLDVELHVSAQPSPTTTTTNTTTTTAAIPTTTAITATITPDGDDRYVFEHRTDGFSVRAPESNTGGNLRVAVIDAAAPVLVDQQSCIDWHGPGGSMIQEGVVLRAKVEQGRTRAVMVTNSIFFAARQGFNVHMVDTNGLNVQGTGPGPEVHPKIAGFDLSAGVGDLLLAKALPWRVCARVIGRELTVKVWAVPSFSQEPSWSDPVFAKSVTLPEQSVYAGQPGAYVGHIKPGEHTDFRHLVAGSVPTEASTPNPPAAPASPVPATTTPSTTAGQTMPD